MLGDGDQVHGTSRRDALVQDRRGYEVAIPQGASPYGWREDEAEDVGIDLNYYWRILLKHRWLVLAIFVVTLALGAGLTMLMTPVYRAETTLQIDREAAKIVQTGDVQPREAMVAGEEFFQTQYGLLKSRSLAATVVRSQNLAANDSFLKRMRVSVPKTDGKPETAQALLEQRAIDVFEENLRVSPVRGSRLVRLSFDSPDPQLAEQIVNATAENFISNNLARRFESSSYARKFLEERLEQTRLKLEESDRQVVAYDTSQQIINVPTGGINADGTAPQSQSLVGSTLVALNTALSTARGDRIKAEQRWRQSQSGDGLGLTETLQNPTIQELVQTRAKAQSELADKSKVLKAGHPEIQQIQSRVAEIERQIQLEVRNVQNSLKMQYDVALAQEKSFEGQVNGLKGSVMDLRERTIQHDILQREADTNRSLYDGLLKLYKEVGVAGGVTTNNIFIVDRAETPKKPAKPKPLLNMLIAALAGLALGVLVALVIELLDESVTNPDDVENKLGVPLLGSVPKLDKGLTPIKALEDIRSNFSEAYYSVRTALQFSTPEGVPASLLITSTRPSEGKSTTALAIARNFASIGSRVLLIDGDLRNPSMHRTMGADNSVGVCNYLTGAASLEAASQATSLPNLRFMPCGPLPPNPAELLASTRVRQLLADAHGSYDIVVVDGPPVLGLADAPLLATILLGTVFVIEAGGTRRGPAKNALRRLRVGNARLLGAVLTKFNAKKQAYGAGYAYAYQYDYGSKPRLPNKG